MSAAEAKVFDWHGEQVRISPWRQSADTALLGLVPGTQAPTADFVRQLLEELGERGFRRALTTALGPLEQPGFLAAGFEVESRLVVLERDLASVPEPPPASSYLRRPRRGDRAAIVAADTLAFGEFWRIDEAGLDDALKATPHSRLRVAASPGMNGASAVVGYAVTGRSGRTGFLQRLAVHPGAQRIGLGSALAVDGMRWLRRGRARTVMVNTQPDNEAALCLYRRLGFEVQPVGLSVLSFGAKR